MKGAILFLLFMVGFTVALEEHDDAAFRLIPRRFAGNEGTESRDSVISSESEKHTQRAIDVEQSEYAERSPLGSTVKKARLPVWRQEHRFLELQMRKRFSASLSKNAVSKDPLDNAQSEMSAQYQQKARVVQGSASAIPPQQQLDLVSSLPGQPKVSFAQYAGYVTVDDTAARALFYYFTEATSSPETKPIILWLNGGPGCSSLGYGAFQELGPFRVNKDGSTLYQNKYSWNEVANTLFLESPAGVGFSYSNDTDEYNHAGDTKTSYDSLVFLIEWFDRFPQYKYRDFYIAGESYAGHFVPQLARRLVDFNKAQATPFINLKGFLVGNALTDQVQDARGLAEYWWNHAIISDETYAQLKCLHVLEYVNQDLGSCSDVLNDAYNEQGNINPYDLYVPVCLAEEGLPNAQRQQGRRPLSGGYDPCVDHYVHAYFNRPDVQEALHADVPYLARRDWESCSDSVTFNYTDIVDSVIPIYEELVPTGLKIWVISGDVDGVVPVSSTRYSLQLLKLETIVPWYAWYLDKQVGGYAQGYDGLTFVTVRDGGHEIPEFQPARDLAVFKSYITGVALQNATQAYNL